MKVKKLGLAKKRGEVYAVLPDGKVIATIKGKAVQVARAKLDASDDFLYFIDDDGDLAREYKSKRKKQTGARPSPTTPASAKLATRALYDRIEDLLFPTDSVNLAHAGFVEDTRANTAARKLYAKEFARLVKEISHALGPPEEIETHLERCLVWELRGRHVQLTLGSEDKEFPASIDLACFDPTAFDA